MRLLFAVAFFAFAGAIFGADASSIKLPDGWDSFRFGLGFVDTDNYAEMEIVIVRRTETGANLIVERYGKSQLKRSINAAELSVLVNELSSFLSGSTSFWKPDQNGPFPQFALIFSIDRGLSRETRSTDLTSQEQVIDRYMKFVEKLAVSDRIE